MSGLHVFSKARERILGGVKKAEFPYVQVPQYYDKSLVVCNRDPRGPMGHQSFHQSPTGTMCLFFFVEK